MSQLLQYYKSFQQSRQATTNTAPTFEDLTIDDSLPELQRLVKYAKSSIGLQRLVHAKMLAYVASTHSIETIKSQIIPLLDVFSSDAESAIRQNLIEQMIPFAKYCSEHNEAGYRLILDYILPVTSKLLEDVKPEVRQAASFTLVEVSKLVKADDLGLNVLTIVLKLAHENDKEEMRMTASELFNMLAECLGQDLCKQFVIAEVVSLAEDPVFRVRKSIALNFHNICKVGGEYELFERLMPAFVRLSKDDMYRVRRACADSLYDISKCVSDDIRVGVLVEIFLRLTQDPSKLVKQSILQQSGMFISTLPSRVVSETILTHYKSMAYEPTGDVNVDNELKHYCAYSFPGVLQTVGSHRWHELRDVYHTLLTSRNINVRTTLSASLHEIARILSMPHDVNAVSPTSPKSSKSNAAIPPTDFEEELLPYFEDMIQDNEEIQIGVMKNLAIFLSLLSEPCRISYLPVLHDILHSTNPFNWRLRQALAIQLSDLIDLPPKCDVYTMLFPLVMTLLQDPVAGVRKDSFKGVSKMILVLYEEAQSELEQLNKSKNKVITGNGNLNGLKNENQSENNNISGGTETSGDSAALSMDNTNKRDLDENGSNVEISTHAVQDLESIIRAVNSLVRGETYQLRQLWVELCHQLLLDLPKDVFEQFFIHGILKLTCDAVSNVRVVLAILLTGWEPNYSAPWIDVDPSTGKDNEHQELELKLSDISIQDNSSANLSAVNPWKWLLKRPDVQECVCRLAKDDYDVYYNIVKLKPMFPLVDFEKISSRGLKQAPGGTEAVALNPFHDSDSIASESGKASSGNTSRVSSFRLHGSDNDSLFDHVYDDVAPLRSKFSSHDDTDDLVSSSSSSGRSNSFTLSPIALDLSAASPRHATTNKMSFSSMPTSSTGKVGNSRHAHVDDDESESVHNENGLQEDLSDDESKLAELLDKYDGI